ncbi:MAG: transposase [Deltaproteobacteria bacterium]
MHAIVSAGGLSPDKARWISTRRKGRFLFPVRILGVVFRAKFRDAMLDALARGQLTTPDDLPADVLDRLRDAFTRTRWVAYAKAPFGGAQQVYRYLGRYTHRVGISNARLRTMDPRGVTFATRGHQTVTVPAVEFLRRFLDHVLPHGFTKIRHDGLLAPCHATTTLKTARALLAPRSSNTPAAPSPCDAQDGPAPQTWLERLLPLTGVDALRCPRCPEGRMTVRPLHTSAPAPDTS